MNLAANSPAIRDAPFGPSPTRVVGLGGLLFEGTQALYGLEGIGGPDALEIGRYEELVDGTGVPRDLIWVTLVTPERLDRMGPLLDLLNVGFVVTPQNHLPAGLVKVGDDADPWIRHRRATERLAAGVLRGRHPEVHDTCRPAE